mmetsp:Transcript_33742/g.47970  ORF Transcript_33742/g.47970 Transcript_33742/m.47970 type:complete len:110 (+) Transcript_33742:54-383(+)
MAPAGTCGGKHAQDAKKILEYKHIVDEILKVKPNSKTDKWHKENNVTEYDQLISLTSQDVYMWTYNAPCMELAADGVPQTKYKQDVLKGSSQGKLIAFQWYQYHLSQTE